MLNSGLARLIGRVNADTVLGFRPRTLLVVSHGAGGGSVGAPQVLYVQELAEASDYYESAEFPPPSRSVQYRVGGSNACCPLRTKEEYASDRRAKLGEK